MARELTDLGIARAIPPLNNRCTYIVSPLSPIQALTSESREFKSRFPTCPSLPVLLAAISAGKPKRWDTILLQFPTITPEVLPYLMRQGWVIQLCQFYFIRIPKRIKLACLDPPSSSTPDDVAGSDALEDSILEDPYRASREEVKWIRKLVEEVATTGGQGQAYAGMFERFAKYFDGKSAKEKILRREQVERAELEGMVEAFRKVGGIIVVQHW